MAGEWRWLALLWLAAGIYYLPVLLGGLSFWIRDTVCIYYPQATITRNALLSGELPLWEPLIGFGYPFQADPHSMVFYPLTVLLLLLPMPRAYDVLVAVHVPLLGTFMYLLLRKWGLARITAAFGAAVAMFCGYTASVTCLTTLLRGSTWTPLALLAFDSFLDGRGWRYAAWTALVLAIEGSCTDPQYVLFTVGLLALSRWLRPSPTPVSIGRTALGIVAAGSLALGLLAYQYLPLGQLIANSTRSSAGGGEDISRWDVNPWNLYNFLYPVPFPDSTSIYYQANFQGSWIPFYPELYFGIPILALALASLGWRKATQDDDRPASGLWRAAQMSLLVSGLAIGLSLGRHTPLFSSLTSLFPPLRFFRFPGKYLLLTGFALPYAAAIGFEGLLARRIQVVRLFQAGLGAGAGLSLGLMAAFFFSGDELTQRFLSGIFDIVGNSQVLFDAFRGAWFTTLSVVLALLASLLGLCWALRRNRIQLGVAVPLIGLIAAGDLAVATNRSLPLAADEVLSSPSKVAEMLRAGNPGGLPPRYVAQVAKKLLFQEKASVFGLHWVMREQLFSMAGIPHGAGHVIGGMSVQLALARGLDLMLRQCNDAEKEQVLRAFGTSHSIEVAGLTPSLPGGRIVGRTGPVVVRELAPVSPRIYIAPRAIGASKEASLPSTQMMMALPETAVFHVPELADSSYEQLWPAEVRACRLLRYSRHEIDVELDLTGSGLLVVLDTFYPGWVARVDGKEREIVKVAGFFRGVRVAGDEHRVEMRYESRPFRTGVCISLTTLLLLIGFLLRGRSRLGPN